LSLITLVKKKRCGKIKGRACADGRKQRRYIKKEEAAAPTLQLESLFLSLMIDANEHRDVATCDIVGAYLMADMPYYVLVRLTIESVEELNVQRTSQSNLYYNRREGIFSIVISLFYCFYVCNKNPVLQI